MKIIKKLLLVLVGTICVLIIAITAIWGYDIKTIRSVTKVDNDNPYLYKMKYVARYDLDKAINADIDSNQKLAEFAAGQITRGLFKVAAPKTDEVGSMSSEHCTSFQAKNADGDGYLFGRNYDFFKNPSIVTFSKPRGGYKSVAVSDMSHIGYGLDKCPTGLKSKIMCLAAIYAPLDGINEKGLCTSIMALPNQPARQETGKHKVPTTLLMRLFLDRCATVDEAVAMLRRYDVNHDLKANSGYHYMVCDANGDCAVIEFDLFDGWKTMIVRKKEGSESMAVTNHLLDPKYYTEEPNDTLGNPHSKSWWRYAVVTEALAKSGGVVTDEAAMEILGAVHWKDLVWDNGMVEDTQYSCVYDQNDLTLKMKNWYNYEDVTYSFKLDGYRLNALQEPSASESL